jgi:hypothetical protein
VPGFACGSLRGRRGEGRGVGKVAAGVRVPPLSRLEETTRVHLKI